MPDVKYLIVGAGMAADGRQRRGLGAGIGLREAGGDGEDSGPVRESDSHGGKR